MQKLFSSNSKVQSVIQGFLTIPVKQPRAYPLNTDRFQMFLL
jgi:hypothetical protein